jgi:hypothetical protein
MINECIEFIQCHWTEIWTAVGAASAMLLVFVTVWATKKIESIRASVSAATPRVTQEFRISKSVSFLRNAETGIPGITNPIYQRRFYFHITVINDHNFSAVKRARVDLRKITEYRPTQGGKDWKPRPIPHQLQYKWSGENHDERFLTFMDQATFDLGFIDRRQPDEFIPHFCHGLTNVGVVKAGQTVRYYIQVSGENAKLKKYAVCELYWDGKVEWDDNAPEGDEVKKMYQHFKFRLVPFPEAEQQTLPEDPIPQAPPAASI